MSGRLFECKATLRLNKFLELSNLNLLIINFRLRNSLCCCFVHLRFLIGSLFIWNQICFCYIYNSCNFLLLNRLLFNFLNDWFHNPCLSLKLLTLFYEVRCCLDFLSFNARIIANIFDKKGLTSKLLFLLRRSLSLSGLQFLPHWV